MQIVSGGYTEIGKCTTEVVLLFNAKQGGAG
jgi:hypothetical protein